MTFVTLHDALQSPAAYAGDITLLRQTALEDTEVALRLHEMEIDRRRDASEFLENLARRNSNAQKQ